MATTQTAIRKLFKETKDGDFFIASSESAIEVIREGGKQNNLIEKDKVFWTFCKTKHDDLDAVRMVFALREANKKVHNVERVTSIIRELETVLTFVDKCTTTKSDGFIYLEAIKVL
jgi:hypothetical protein